MRGSAVRGHGRWPGGGTESLRERFRPPPSPMGNSSPIDGGHSSKTCPSPTAQNTFLRVRCATTWTETGLDYASRPAIMLAWLRLFRR